MSTPKLFSRPYATPGLCFLTHRKKEGQASPRDDLAAYGIAWAFWRRLPLPALTYFVKRAAEDDLRWPITYMLRGVDHPDAVEFIANQLAARSRELAGSDSFDLFSRTVTDHWSRRQRDQEKPMNRASRNRLQRLWEDGDNDRHLRRHAFRMWAASSYPDDISILSTDEFPSFLKDDVLRARLERSDKSAVPMLIKKIKEKGNHNYWWQHARDVWTDELTALLDEQLAVRASTTSPYWGRSIGTDWMLSEMVIRQDQSTAEKLLRSYWENLRFSPYFFQAALYVATPRMLELVKNAIAECTSPKEMFEHITHHFGIKTIGHPGVTRTEQVRGLVPYLDHIDDMEMYQFWELCNERGWVALRREDLDCRLSGKWRKLSGLDDATLYNELDEELANDKHPWMDYWVEKQLDNGRSRENILSVVRSWLKANQTTKALEVAASVVVHSGSRIDINLLSEGCDQTPLTDEIIQDTTFAVKKRRLS